MSSQPTLVIVPGWRNSGPGHWQSLWAQRLSAVRVDMAEDDWQRPKRNVWVQAIARTILAQPGPVVVAAHSLGCIATTHLPSDVARRIRGALLVAPADPERRGVLADFAPVPYQPLPYRSVVVASTTDPFCPVRTAGAYARSWGSEVVRLQNAGHINVEPAMGNGLLAWPCFNPFWLTMPGVVNHNLNWNFHENLNPSGFGCSLVICRPGCAGANLAQCLIRCGTRVLQGLQRRFHCAL